MIEIGFQSLLCHFIGDYWLQNDWMALNKKNNFWIALVHSMVYTLTFLFITRSILVLSVICLTHAIIDHTNIVGRLNQIKNWHFGPATLKDDSVVLVHVTPERYFADYTQYIDLEDGYTNRPLFIRVWLLIIQDNILHILINYLSILYLGGLI